MIIVINEGDKMLKKIKNKCCACLGIQSKDFEKDCSRCICLNDVDNNTEVELLELCNNKHLNKKLKAMGLTTGIKLRVIQNEKEGPVVLNVRGSKLALGHGMSKKIFVKKVL